MRLHPVSSLCAALLLCACNAERSAQSAEETAVEAVAESAAQSAVAGPAEGVMSEAEASADAGAPIEDTAFANVDGATESGEPPAAAKASPGRGVARMIPGSLPYCAPIRDYMAEAQCERIIRQMASLEQGVGAFSPPRTMQRGQRRRVSFAIGAASDREDTVAAAGGNAEQAQVRPIRIGRFMRATLTGANFTIERIGEADRDLGASSSELWQWDVTPTDDGPQSLQVVVETFSAPPGSEGPTRLALYRSPPITVTVNVGARDQRTDRIKRLEEESGLWETLVESWIGLALAISGLILVLGGIWWRLRHFGKSDTTPGAGDSAEQGEPEG